MKFVKVWVGKLFSENSMTVGIGLLLAVTTVLAALLAAGFAASFIAFADFTANWSVMRDPRDMLAQLHTYRMRIEWCGSYWHEYGGSNPLGCGESVMVSSTAAEQCRKVEALAHQVEEVIKDNQDTWFLNPLSVQILRSVRDANRDFGAHAMLGLKIARDWTLHFWYVPAAWAMVWLFWGSEAIRMYRRRKRELETWSFCE